jgi:hypothetical protein
MAIDGAIIVIGLLLCKLCISSAIHEGLQRSVIKGLRENGGLASFALYDPLNDPWQSVVASDTVVHRFQWLS